MIHVNISVFTLFFHVLKIFNYYYLCIWFYLGFRGICFIALGLVEIIYHNCYISYKMYLVVFYCF